MLDPRHIYCFLTDTWISNGTQESTNFSNLLGLILDSFYDPNFRLNMPVDQSLVVPDQETKNPEKAVCILTADLNIPSAVKPKDAKAAFVKLPTLGERIDRFSNE